MPLTDLLTDRRKLTILFWVGFVSSLFFIGLGLYIIVRDLLG